MESNIFQIITAIATSVTAIITVINFIDNKDS